MYVCIYIVYICIYTYIHTYIHINTYTSVFLKPTSLQTSFFFNATERMLEAFFWMTVFFCFFFPSFEINDMHVQTVFYRSWKATCFNELLLLVVHKELTVYSHFVDLSWGRPVQDNAEGIRFNAPFLTLLMLLKEDTASASSPDLKLVHFVVVFTLKRVDSLRVVYFTHGFSTKEGRR